MIGKLVVLRVYPEEIYADLDQVDFILEENDIPFTLTDDEDYVIEEDDIDYARRVLVEHGFSSRLM